MLEALVLHFEECERFGRAHVDEDLEGFLIFLFKNVQSVEDIAFDCCDLVDAFPFQFQRRLFLDVVPFLLNCSFDRLYECLTINQLRVHIVEAPLEFFDLLNLYQILQNYCVSLDLQLIAEFLSSFVLGWRDLALWDDVEEIDEELVLHQFSDPECPTFLVILLI